MAWVLVARHQDNIVETYLRGERANAERDLATIKVGVTEQWESAEGFMGTLARQENLLDALLEANERDTNPDSDRKPRPANAGESATTVVSRYFYGMIGDLKFISIIALIDRAGNCIAASNGTSAASLIGTNYLDRPYFVGAMNGGQIRQFTTGRATGQTGLFVTQPVYRQRKVEGVMMAKLDQSTMAPWINIADSFIMDEYGVIMIAHDSNLTFHTMPRSRINERTEAERALIYQRTNFSPLELTPVLGASHPEIFKMAARPTPIMLVTAPLIFADSQVGVMQPLPKLQGLLQDKLRLFTLVALGGIGLILVTFFLRLRFAFRGRQIAGLEYEIELHQLAFDSASVAIGVFAESGECRFANDAMAALFNTARHAMVEQNYRKNELWQEAGLVNAANQVFESGATQRGHWRLARKFRQEIWVEAAMRRFSLKSSNYLLVILTDVTDEHWRDSASSM